MIRKEELIENSKKKQLNGALVDEYHLENDESIKLINSYNINYNGYENNVTIARVDQPQIVDLENDFLDVDYSLYMNKNNEEIGFARTSLQIYMRKLTYRAVPFKEFKMEPKDLEETKKIGDGKHSCMIIDIELMAKISFTEEKSDIYEDLIPVAVDLNGCYIYCINYIDGTLPTVLVSKDIISKSELENAVFEQSTDIIFNSYYHPHQYRQVTQKIYPDTVFGSPGGNLKGLSFNEKKVNYKDYENSDGIFGEYNDETGTMTVKFTDHTIARYTKGGISQNDINSILMYDEYKLSFFEKEFADETISAEDLIKKYNNPVLNNIRSGKDITYRVFDSFTDEVGGIYYDFISKDEISIIKISNDNNFIELFSIFNKKHNESTNEDFTYPKTIKQYAAFDVKKNLGYSIYTAINEDTNLECYINSTNNRLINVSRDANNIMFNSGKYYITCNKNNDVINTNMGIEGQIVPYNIFGIPVKF